MITIAQLQYVVALDTYRQFVTAAEKCYVTQPTLSMQIKKLEDHLGIKLFDRSKQPLIPTAIGKQVIEQARIILGEIKNLEELIAEQSNTESGTIRMGIIPSIAPYLVPLFIGKFKKDYPQISLLIEELLTEEIVLKLKKIS